MAGTPVVGPGSGWSDRQVALLAATDMVAARLAAGWKSPDDPMRYALRLADEFYAWLSGGAR